MAEIRKTVKDDLPAVLSIYAGARDFMRENGNSNQWGSSYPPREMIEKDIQAGKSYVCGIITKSRLCFILVPNVTRHMPELPADG